MAIDIKVSYSIITVGFSTVYQTADPLLLGNHRGTSIINAMKRFCIFAAYDPTKTF